jgi:hypothetical protein
LHPATTVIAAKSQREAQTGTCHWKWLSADSSHEHKREATRPKRRNIKKQIPMSLFLFWNKMRNQPEKPNGSGYISETYRV